MSTESARVHSCSDSGIGGSSPSKIDQMSDTQADPLSGQNQELDGNEQQGIGSLDSASDLVTEKVNEIKEELDLGIGIQNVDVETNEIEKKVSVDSEKDSGEIQTELVVDKEVESNMVSSPSCSEELSEPNESKEENMLNDDNSSVTANLKLSDSDLVWAKVRSHPWWPGQVFKTSAATDKAKKYYKKGSYLVTYFGDCSFAWNDASKLKPFRQNFSQMANQSSLPDFVDAVDFALEEVSRRIEFGLACSCISDEVYEEIRFQNIINPAILEESSRIHGGDKVSSAAFFEPGNLVEYMRRLACSADYDASDELELVTHRAQLLAFSRWKGYSDLPEFDTLEGSLESAAPKISPREEKGSSSVPQPKKTEQVYTKKRKTEDKDEFEYEDTTVLKKRKKEKTLAEFIAEKRVSISNEKKRSCESSGVKPESEKKRKIVYSKPLKSAKKVKASLQTEDHPGDKITPEKKGRTSFGIGASILRVFNQMNCSTTPTGLIPCSNTTSKNNGTGKTPRAEALISPSLSATRTSNGKPSPDSINDIQFGEVEQAIKVTPCTTVEDSMLDSRDLKESTKEQTINEDKKEASNVVGETSSKDMNLTEELITGSDVQKLSDIKNSSGGSVSCPKETSSVEYEGDAPLRPNPLIRTRPLL